MSQGHHSRHAEYIKRALAAAKIPSQCGISQCDGKRPDGTSVFPWKNGRILVWDVTSRYLCSFLCQPISGEPGAVADRAECLNIPSFLSLTISCQWV